MTHSASCKNIFLLHFHHKFSPSHSSLILRLSQSSSIKSQPRTFSMMPTIMSVQTRHNILNATRAVLLLLLLSILMMTEAFVAPTLTERTRSTTPVMAMPASSSVTAAAATFAMVPFPPFVLQRRRRTIHAWQDVVDEQVQVLQARQRKFVSNVAMQLTLALTDSTTTTTTTTTTTSAMPLQQSSSSSTAALPAAKLLHLSNQAMADIILSDCRDRQFLYTANLTREIYHDACQFKDGSNLDGSYPLEAWVRGCQFLFDATASHCRILPHTLRVTDRAVSFRFAETLAFNTPSRHRPRVHITGTVHMKRDAETGLVVSYEEDWDQDLTEIFRRTTF